MARSTTEKNLCSYHSSLKFSVLVDSSPLLRQFSEASSFGTRVPFATESKFEQFSSLPHLPRISYAYPSLEDGPSSPSNPATMSAQRRLHRESAQFD